MFLWVLFIISLLIFKCNKPPKTTFASRRLAKRKISVSDRVGIKLLGSFIDPENFQDSQKGEIVKLRSALLSGDFGNLISIFEETQTSREQNSGQNQQLLDKSRFLIEQLKNFTRT